ncbi:HSP20-like chaperone [Neocallimastix californiae]|uniref:HSP20-like chaperone n=1 Tax=Neocallimastix californiae TaxID=1754190 RepID=A0A1Y2BPG1_9FUNG|nr:HSP20-like chaperone [Neocallimastix californiae]|eukprot:ORY36616.1 HSP20-like chaperone [Neocallimastix californiae]
MSVIQRKSYSESKLTPFDKLFIKEFANEPLFNDHRHQHHFILKDVHLPHHLLQHHHHHNLFNKIKKEIVKTFNKNNSYTLEDFLPRFNFSEDKNGYYLHADLPGVTKDQINIEIIDDIHLLIISCEKKIMNNDSKDKCCFGRFKRSFQIPENADLQSTQAKIENGILEMSVKKIRKNNDHVHRIEIQ